MRRLLALTSVALTLAAAEKPHVVFLLGEAEHHPERTMPPIAKELESRHGFRCTVLNSTETDMPGLDALGTADLAVFYLGNRNFPPEQMNKIRAYVDSGKPVVALRTSSHGFTNWKEFGEQVLGAPWRYHYGSESSTEVGAPIEGAIGHPILENLPLSFKSRSPLYHVLPIAEEAQPLLNGQSVGPSQRPWRAINPVAWTFAHKGARVFYTSLGHPEDFQIEAFRRLLVNAIFWVLNRPAP